MRSDHTPPVTLDFLTPGGGLQGPVFTSLLGRLLRAPTKLEPGARVGPYRVIDTLGTGGMAAVYLAERADGEFEQRVALKLVTTDGGTDAATGQELLRRERQILARLEHPRIARLLDGGTTDEGALWFAMEVVEGERIDRWCAARRADRHQRLELFLQVCDAVGFAHAHLLVHRDLKPSNILVTQRGEVKLLDFGIAAVTQPGHEHAAPRALTPGYASPEQRRGEIETTASDIWQLGRLLDVLVFSAEAGLEPRAPSSMSRRGDPDDRDLRAIIGHACHDDPARRYASVGDLAADLRRALERRPVQAREATLAYRLGRFLQRNRIATATSTVALMAFVGMASAFALRLAEERDAARREAERANAAVGFLVGVFRSNDPNENRGRTPDANELLARGGERLDRELADQPQVRARLLAAIAQIQLSLGEPNRALELFDRSLALANSQPDYDPDALIDAALTRAEIVLSLGRPLEVLAALDEIEPLIDPDSEAGRRALVRVYGARAMAQLGSGDVPAGIVSENHAINLARNVFGADSVEAAARMHDLGILYRSGGDFRAAANAFEDSWLLYRGMHGADHPRYIAVQKHYAMALLELGKLDDAEPLLLDAIEKQRVLYESKGAVYGAAMRSLARLKHLRGDLAGSLAAMDESVRLIEEATGPDTTALGFSLQQRGGVHAALDDPRAALRDYERTLAIRRARLPEGHLGIAEATGSMAVQHLRLGEGAAAEAAATETWRLRKARSGESDPQTLRALVLIGLARAAQGDAIGAQARYDEALRLAPTPAVRTELETLIATPEKRTHP